HRVDEEGPRGLNLGGSLAEPLLLVHRVVRHLDQGVDGDVVAWHRPRYTDAELQPVLMRPCVVAVVDVLAQAGEGHLDSFVGLCQQYAKLVAAGSSDHVRLSKRGGQDLTELEQRLVTHRVTEGVVDALEPIEVDQQEVHRALLPASDFAHVGRECSEAATVVDVRERVDQRQLSRFFFSLLSDADLSLQLFIAAPCDLHRALGALEQLEGAQHTADKGGKVSDDRHELGGTDLPAAGAVPEETGGNLTVDQEDPGQYQPAFVGVGPRGLRQADTDQTCRKNRDEEEVGHLGERRLGGERKGEVTRCRSHGGTDHHLRDRGKAPIEGLLPPPRGPTREERDGNHTVAQHVTRLRQLRRPGGVVPNQQRGDDHMDAEEYPRAKESQRKIKG